MKLTEVLKKPMMSTIEPRLELLKMTGADEDLLIAMLKQDWGDLTFNGVVVMQPGESDMSGRWLPLMMRDKAEDEHTKWRDTELGKYGWQGEDLSDAKTLWYDFDTKTIQVSVIITDTLWKPTAKVRKEKPNPFKYPQECENKVEQVWTIVAKAANNVQRFKVVEIKRGNIQVGADQLDLYKVWRGIKG